MCIVSVYCVLKSVECGVKCGVVCGGFCTKVKLLQLFKVIVN